jgi:hypothetical protein
MLGGGGNGVNGVRDGMFFSLWDYSLHWIDVCLKIYRCFTLLFAEVMYETVLMQILKGSDDDV